MKIIYIYIMSSCMYTAQGDFVCNENKDTT